MLEIILTTTATLAIVLYMQARQAAREIRRNRDNASGQQLPTLLFPPEH
ncbi:hypothetical protein RSK20926_14559 [Roseobacter sp. SK209-2-6]|nr:hypothetical protein [Roseobacter sp. SK209-2-6]EBA15861.1 hypothetical protein RSK20926_14559 [Roseobacter sp. SK209-2-6]